MVYKVFDKVEPFGTAIANLSRAGALDAIYAYLNHDVRACHPIYIVNVHTKNLAIDDPYYSAVLNESALTFGDGTGVRWAARAKAATMKANLVGTDLIPALLNDERGRGFSYFLLGSDQSTIERAAEYARVKFPTWRQAGFRQGCFDQEGTRLAIEEINKSGTSLLLVGMGNPRQEKWIHEHRLELEKSSYGWCWGAV